MNLNRWLAIALEAWASADFFPGGGKNIPFAHGRTDGRPCLKGNPIKEI